MFEALFVCAYVFYKLNEPNVQGINVNGEA